MKLKTIFFFYVFLPLLIFMIVGEIWIRHNRPIHYGSDRVPHPYIQIGGFYKGGYYKNSMDPKETPEAFGYENKTWLNVPAFKFGSPVKSISERGTFLYRDRAHLVTAQKSKDETRVFVLGGSVAFGEGASQPENRWFVQLERLLREKTGKNIVVIPAANHSHVSTQERIIYDLYVSPFSPDVVIFLDGFNDANTAVSASRPGDPFGQGTIYLRDRSPLYGFLNDIGKHVRLVQYFIEQTIIEAWSNPITPETLASQAESVASVYYDNLANLNKRCRNEKVKCVFFLQPYWNQTLRNRNIAPENCDLSMDSNYKRLLELKTAYPFVTDFTGVFDDAPEVPFFDPAHFNDKGHLILAEKMADFLIRKKVF